MFRKIAQNVRHSISRRMIYVSNLSVEVEGHLWCREWHFRPFFSGIPIQRRCGREGWCLVRGGFESTPGKSFFTRVKSNGEYEFDIEKHRG